MWTEQRTRAMGTVVQIVGPAGYESVLGRAVRRLSDLERRWSRFLPDSELSQVNANPGRPVIVSPETFAVISMAIDAWRSTAGRFDPTTLAALIEQGYDRSFDLLDAAVDADGDGTPAPTPRDVVLDDGLDAVTVPIGVSLDLGGIGKGAAADLIVAECERDGLPGICVNIGGDARVRGEAPTEGHWRVVLRCPGSVETRAIDLVDGAACTSSRLRRRWTNRRGPAHHLIDPATGRPAATGIDSVGVVAATAVQAEVLAKTALLTGIPGAVDLLTTNGVDAAIVTEHGSIHDVGTSARPAGPDGIPLNPVVSADGNHRD